MATCLIAAAIAFVGGLALTLAARKVGVQLGVVDYPDGYRKLHKKPIPLTGGQAIFLAFMLPLAVLAFYDGNGVRVALKAYNRQVWTLLVGALAVLAMGTADDIWNLRPRYKVLFQVLAATLAYFGGFAISRISIPFGQPISLGIFSYPITLLWFVGCMNAINLLDGLDGLAAGVGLFVSLTMAIVSVSLGHLGCMFLTASLSGAILAFLVFNFNPASIFLGDSGSMVIGYLVAALSLLGALKAETAVALLIPFIALGLPVFDSALAIVRRWGRRLPIAAADRQHIHHALVKMGLSQRAAVLVLYVVCLAFGGTALLISAGRNRIAFLVLGAVLISAYVSVRILRMVDLGQVMDRIRDDMDHSRRAGEASVAVEQTVERMVEAETLEALWEGLFAAFERLDLDHVECSLHMSGGTRKLIWRRAGQSLSAGPDHADRWSVSLELRHRDDLLGHLEIWKYGDSVPLHNAYLLINRLRHRLGSQIFRLHPVPQLVATEVPTTRLARPAAPPTPAAPAAGSS